VEKDRSRFLDALVAKKGKKKLSPNPTGVKQQTKSQSAAGPASSSRRFSTAGSANRYSGRTFVSNRRTHSPVPAPQKARKLTGTSSVYARRAPSLFDSPVSQDPQSRQAQARPRPASTKSQQSSKTSSPRPGLSERSNVPPPALRSERLARKGTDPSPPKKVAPRPVDSSWFFPVGSKVKHKQLGEGVVLPSREKGAEQDVHVKFGSGEQRSFPLHGSDLSPVI